MYSKINNLQSQLPFSFSLSVERRNSFPLKKKRPHLPGGLFFVVQTGRARDVRIKRSSGVRTHGMKYGAFVRGTLNTLR